MLEHRWPAVTAMIDVAMRCADGPVSIQSVAGRQNLSVSYLEQLFGQLRRARIVNSVRGPGGGYVVIRPAFTLTVADILAAVRSAEDLPTAAPNDPVETQTMFGVRHRIAISLDQALGAITLADLIADARRRHHPQYATGAAV